MRYRIFKIIFLVILMTLLTSQVAWAQGGFQIVKCGTTANPTECTIPDLKMTVVRIVNYLLAWAWLVALLFILWAAWNMVISGGDSEKITAARSTLNNAIAGFFLVTIAFILLNFIVFMLTGKPLREIIDFLP